MCIPSSCCRSKPVRRPDKITRRVEHVDYVTNRPKHIKSSKPRVEPEPIIQNNTAVCFFTVSTNLESKCFVRNSTRPIRPSLTYPVNLNSIDDKTPCGETKIRDGGVMEYPTIYNDRNLGLDLQKIYVLNHNICTFRKSYKVPLKQNNSDKETNNKKAKTKISIGLLCCPFIRSRRKATQSQEPTNNTRPRNATYHIKNIKLETHEPNPITGVSYDFGCQYSLKSNYSLEIVSHMLSKSESQPSSLQSDAMSVKWRRLFRPDPHKKRPNVFQVLIMSIARKIKTNNNRIIIKHKKNNVVVLHVPNKFSETSSLSTMSPMRTKSGKVDKIDKPLVIKDESPRDSLMEMMSRNKICGPGEIFTKHHNM